MCSDVSHVNEETQPSDSAELVVTRLVRAQEVKLPEVHAWQFIDLEKEEQKREQEIRSEVYEQIQRELQPQITRQTAILKREAYEEAKQSGYEDGYQAGFEAGQAQGLEKAENTAQAELAPKVAMLEKVLASLVQPQQLIENKVFVQLAEMTIMLAERIINDAVIADPQRITRFIEEAVALLPEAEAKIDVELHPDDFNVVSYYQQQNAKPWTLIATAQISPGTCRVKRLNSVVNHNWKQRVAKLLTDTEQLALSLVDSDVLEDDASSSTSSPAS